MTNSPVQTLLTDIRACRVCASHLPQEPRPILAAREDSRLLIIGQAPGRRAHASGVPWQDASGATLREWLLVSLERFYDSGDIACVPMGFCFPGAGRGGDLAPRPECAPLWHARLLAALPNTRLTLLIGRYAQLFHLRSRAKRTLTETVAGYCEYLPRFFPLPHPSPRNRIWLHRNPWFVDQLLPVLRQRVESVLAD